MSKKKIAGIVLLGVLLIGQFIRPTQNSGSIAGPNHISNATEVPQDIEEILGRACYDCHSDKTEYPSYANLFPVSWFLNNHIKGGIKHLNFSQFKTYEAKKAAHKMEEIVEVIEKNEMPMKSYTWLHSEAKLSGDDKTKLII